jgi:hypothetical protein
LADIQPKYDAEAQIKFCIDLAQEYGSVVTTAQIREYVDRNKIPYPYFLTMKNNSTGWGKYDLSKQVPSIKQMARHNMSAPLTNESIHPEKSLIPRVDPTYVPFGFYDNLAKIIESGIFFPVYITGLSGNGKTLMVEQICAALKRELVPVPVTKRTDEMDLFGGYELVNGNTIRNQGPVLYAMERGAILLLDEVDYGTEDLLCMQSVLAGNPYLDKKTNKLTYPAPGFNIMATANTKGKGTSDGRFVGANVLNEAFLERFSITVDQQYPKSDTELDILTRNFTNLGLSIDEHKKFLKCLVSWSELSRKSYEEGSITDLISTRRLVHIARSFKIFGNKRTAIQMCLNRFDEGVSKPLMDFYAKIDADLDRKEKEEQLRQAREKNKSKTPGPIAAAPPATTPDMLPYSSKLSKKYKLQVNVVKSKNKIGNDEVTVYSHGEYTSMDWDSIKKNLSIEDSLSRMVEVNKLSSNT